MKRKKPAPVRRSGRLASKSGIEQPKLKLLLQQRSLSGSASCSSSGPGQLRMNHELKQQIQPRSLSSSCSSSCPSQLRKNRENMGKSVHRWTKAEEEYLVQLTKDPKMAELYSDWRNGFYAAAAKEMNEHWKGAPRYVPLDATKVENKIRQSRKEFRATKEGTSSGTLFAQLGMGFTSSVSVGAKKKEPTGPFDSESVLKYLVDNGCPNVELYKFAIALENERVLRLFNLKGTYEERIEFLKDLLASGELETP